VVKSERRLYCFKEEDGKQKVVMFLNPGFSVSDYQWANTLQSVSGIFISTCHSEEEAFVERNMLKDFQCLAHVANPWAPLRYHQSGTIATEVYRKNSIVSIYQRKEMDENEN